MGQVRGFLVSDGMRNLPELTFSLISIDTVREEDSSRFSFVRKVQADGENVAKRTGKWLICIFLFPEYVMRHCRFKTQTGGRMDYEEEN